MQSHELDHLNRLSWLTDLWRVRRAYVDLSGLLRDVGDVWSAGCTWQPVCGLKPTVQSPTVAREGRFTASKKPLVAADMLINFRAVQRRNTELSSPGQARASSQPHGLLSARLRKIALRRPVRTSLRLPDSESHSSSYWRTSIKALSTSLNVLKPSYTTPNGRSPLQNAGFKRP